MKPIGFNVIGHVSGNLGLGVSARQVASLIRSRNLPLAILDLDPGGGRGGHDQSFHDYAVPSPEALPHAINLFVLPPPTLSALAESPTHRRLLLRSDRIQTALIAWEHIQIPRPWLPTLRMLDVIVAQSHFVHAVFATHLDNGLAIPAILPLHLPAVVPSRQHFQLPPNAFIFVTSFEPQSDPERKNPIATIEAFRHAFPTESAVMLVIKINNPVIGHRPHPIVLRLRAESARDSRIRIIEDFFTYEEVLTLYAASDVFVSLHRSEGFGLGLSEAMALGKPVIATAWSGNMTFMNSLNSCLVSYRLVPVRATHPVYSRRLLGPGAVWADPDLADASAWMIRLVNDPMLRSLFGSRAAASMAAYEKEADRGFLLDELIAIAEFLPRMPSFQSKKARFPAFERQLVRRERRRAVRRYIARLISWHLRSKLNSWFHKH